MITNKMNLPQAFLNYANSEKGNREYLDKVFSVTELLQSTKVIRLKRLYRDKIDVDISDMIPALFGTAVHSVMEKNADPDVYTEYSISAMINGCVIKGRIDVLNIKEELIEDYKTCSVSKIMKQDFEDWKLQGLMYAYICYLMNIKIKKLKFYALMKDWSKVKSASNINYPANAIYVWEYKIEDSDLDFIDNWMKNRLKDILQENIPDCSEEDRWYTGTKYAIYKKEGDKRATIVCDSEEEAKGYIANKLEGVGKIEVRKGEYLKCNYYCECKQFCNQCKEEE